VPPAPRRRGLIARRGAAQNTFHTLRDMRIVFADGTLLDTSDAASRDAFKKSHAALLKARAATRTRLARAAAALRALRAHVHVLCACGAAAR
jgi:D-lactate dehydrogenase